MLHKVEKVRFVKCKMIKKSQYLDKLFYIDSSQSDLSIT